MGRRKRRDHPGAAAGFAACRESPPTPPPSPRLPATAAKWLNCVRDLGAVVGFGVLNPLAWFGFRIERTACLNCSIAALQFALRCLFSLLRSLSMELHFVLPWLPVLVKLLLSFRIGLSV